MSEIQTNTVVIIRDVYAKAPTKSKGAKADADYCTNRDYIGCMGVVIETDGKSAVVAPYMAHTSGDRVPSAERLTFAVGMLEAV